MRLFTTVAGIRRYLAIAKADGRQQGGQRATDKHRADPSFLPQVTVGLVPTMGALHDGHLSLIRRACQETDVVVVSIFVNPLQFAPHEDLDTYPRSLEQDQQRCEEVGVSVVFAPSVKELYGTALQSPTEQMTHVIPPKQMTARLCGNGRPGHFEGVATIVVKLFNIIRPDRAYFGQKDAQQLAILKQVTSHLNLDVELVACAIVREPSGLAMSSRNTYLSSSQRQEAALLYRGLKNAEQLFKTGLRDRPSLVEAVRMTIAKAPEIRVEYIDLVHPDTMTPIDTIDESGLLAVAAHVGNTRLIDNIVLRNRQPIIAIDGPAGAGKSTVARQIAQKLGLLYLDTGAMYRAVTWFVMNANVPVDDEPGVAELLSHCEIRLSPDDYQATSCRVWVNGQEVSDAIRTPQVTSNVSAIAAHPSVRDALVQQQRRYGKEGGIVMDGRDIGTHVFPNAELKIFLTASVQERARRRQKDLSHQGRAMSLQNIEQSIYERDLKDSTRAIAPLRQAPDACVINTDALSVDEVIEHIVGLYHERENHN
ncbi:MAG: bifunctional pantoate--beta-alanine ligase/(d)CMP kinase [Leptolyngbyaceae bacterium]|nr:bifunctional pantoate--beta-alanine ligase/(d)CMP kinase [Leptolyngbyaceae bacterium]